MAIPRCPPFRDSLPPAKQRPDCMGPIDWAATRFPICWSSAKGGRVRRAFREGAHRRAEFPEDQIQKAATHALAPFEGKAGGKGENPFQLQEDLQDMMQDLVGIVRKEDEMNKALVGLEKLKERAKNIVVKGNREYNAGWHTALDIDNLLLFPRPLRARRSSERKVAEGTSVTIIQKRTRSLANSTSTLRKPRKGRWSQSKEPVKPLRADLQAIIEEMK